MIKSDKARPRILIVEDEAVVALDIEGSLKKLGYSVLAVVTSGEAAIRCAAELQPELVLMDIKLRGQMDGVTAAEQIRTRRDIPIVYLTAYSDEVLLQRAKFTEPAGYVLKPIEIKELHSAIEMALYKHAVEKKLRESEARYRAITELTSDYAYSFYIKSDGTRQTEWVTEAYPLVTGFTLEETEARGGWKSLVHPDDLPRYFERMEVWLSGQRSVDEFRILHWDGKVRWLRVHSVPVWDEEEKRVVRVYGAVEDFTERKQAQEALQQRNRELELLNRAGREFNASLNLEEVLANILEEVGPLLGVSGASVWLIDPTTKELVCREASGPSGEKIRGWRLPPGEGIVGWVAQHGQNLIVSDVLADERHAKSISHQIGLQVRSILNVPLKTKQEVIGVLQVVDVRAGRFDADPANLRLIESLATTAASAIENARLYEAAQELQKQAQQDAATKALLLREVNHRVTNNLTAIIGLLSIERSYAETGNQVTYQAMRQKLVSRVRSLATVHNLLSASSWAPLRLSELARQIISSVIQALPVDQQVMADVPMSPIRVTPEQAHNLALVINELATNATRHARPAPESYLHLTVQAAIENNNIRLEFRDNGPGYPEEILGLDRQKHNVGFELIKNIVRRDLRGTLLIRNDHGAVATIQFKNEITPVN